MCVGVHVRVYGRREVGERRVRGPSGGAGPYDGEQHPGLDAVADEIRGW